MPRNLGARKSSGNGTVSALKPLRDKMWEGKKISWNESWHNWKNYHASFSVSDALYQSKYSSNSSVKYMCLSQPLAALAAIQPPQTEKKVTVYDVQKVRLWHESSAPLARQPFVSLTWYCYPIRVTKAGSHPLILYPLVNRSMRSSNLACIIIWLKERLATLWRGWELIDGLRL